ncbi:MAG: DMT family transporter [Candidatus Marsarchaeota archaeon]|nr:DMT family transporter [Candidatus Marsarchaeota archaeon]
MNLSPKQWVVLTAVISGVAVYYNSIAVRGLDPVGFAMAKNMMAALGLVGILAIGAQWRQFISFSRQQWLQLLAIAVIGGSIPFALFFGGLSMAANGAGASFIYRLLFIFSAILAVAFLREKPNWKTAGGVGIILLANILLLLNFKSFAIGTGELMVLAATLMWSTENILLKKALAWISPDALAAARLGMGGLILLAASAVLAPAGMATISALPLVPLILSALLILGFTMTYYRGLAGTSVSEATAILTLGGLVSALLPILLNNRLPGVIEGLSLALIGLGVAVVLASAGKRAASDGLSPCKA